MYDEYGISLLLQNGWQAAMENKKKYYHVNLAKFMIGYMCAKAQKPSIHSCIHGFHDFHGVLLLLYNNYTQSP